MKTKMFLSVLFLALIVSAFGQKSTLELTFTAVDNISYLQLDRIYHSFRFIPGHTNGNLLRTGLQHCSAIQSVLVEIPAGTLEKW